MAEINWTAEAERWLRDIYHYIAQDNPESADRVIVGIYEKAQLLRRFHKWVTGTIEFQTSPFASCSTDITGSPISSSLMDT
jgi:plasmid stabilization system protein ParE